MKNLTQISNHIGVWMDYNHARMVYRKNDGTYAIETLESLHDIHPRIDGQGSDKTQWGGHFRYSDNESKKNHKETEQLHQYYKNLEKILSNYDDILIAGPTHAKDEFFNLLLTDKSFDGKRLGIESADKLTDNQLIALVEKYFENGVVKTKV